MLTITTPRTELFDEKLNRFIYIESETLTLEHSLIAVSKWEAKWCVPFFGNKDRTSEQTLDYIRCMCMSKVKDDRIFDFMPKDTLAEIVEYIESKQTATWFSDKGNKRRGREIITSELVYYWMILYNIPFECQKWHINRLLTLIRICSEKQKPAKKMSAAEMMRQQNDLNAARCAALHTSG